MSLRGDGEGTPDFRGLAMKPLTKQLSMDDGCSVDGLSPVQMDSSTLSDRSFAFSKTEENGLEHKSSAFRRFKSMPGPFCSLENTSPQKSVARDCPFSTLAPQEVTPEKGSSRAAFFLGDDLSPEKDDKTQDSCQSPDGKSIFPSDHDESSQDSGLGLEKDYKEKGLSPFAKPQGPAPRRVRINSDDSTSPHKVPRAVSQRRSSTPDFSLHFSPGVMRKDSPVKLRTSSLTLTPEEDDGDDGFLEFGDSCDIQESMPSGLKGLISKPLLQSNAPPSLLSKSTAPSLPRVAELQEEAENIKPSKSKRGLFRSPSTPRLFSNWSFPWKNKSQKTNNKRGSPNRDDDTPVNLKRRRSVIFGATPEKMETEPKPRLQRSQSEAMIKSALDKSHEEPVIGDFTKPFCLPTIPGKKSDLKSITPSVMARLLNSEFSHEVEKFVIIDCRYPYEFEGGHIQDALNIWERDPMIEDFMTSDKHRQPLNEPHKRRILIFHCEFSSERGPKMSRFLRKMDREMNKECYPSLHYPEMYLLEGGYKAFFEKHMTWCQPATYLPMAHEQYLDDLKHCRAKSKSWAGEKASKSSRMGFRQLQL